MLYWHSGSHQTSSSTGSPSFPGLEGPEESGPPSLSGIGPGLATTVPGSQDGFTAVENTTNHKPLLKPEASIVIQIGASKQGWGWEVDCRGIRTPYQLPRTESSLLAPQSFVRDTSEVCPDKNGQPDSHSLCE